MSIDELIQELETAKQKSKLGGRTQVYFIREEVEPIPLLDVELIEDPDGAIVELIGDP